MDGEQKPPETVEAPPVVETPTPKKRTLLDAFVKFVCFWSWEVKPKGEKKPPKPLKWWAIWRYKFWHAPPPSLQRSIIPTLASLMKVDPQSWNIMGRWSNRLAVGAVLANFVICASYAFIVATQSELPLTRGWDARLPIPFTGQDLLIGDIARWTVICVFALMAFITAAVMQLGSDFAIPFGAGLAGERYRLIPTLSLVTFLVCITLTASIKIDVFTGWGRGRMAEAAEMVTLSEADQRVLAKYEGHIPPPVSESQAKVNIANAELERLKTLRTETAATRTREETDITRPGRGPRWDELNGEVQKIDTDIAGQTGALTLAETAKASRLEYDTANENNKARVRDVTEAERSLVYDSDFIVWIRSIGASLLSPFFVLCSFMIRAARYDAAKKAAAKEKELDTKREKKNTTDAEFTETVPLDTRLVDHDPNVKDGAVDRADTPRRQPGRGPEHPDATGDEALDPNKVGYGNDDAELPGQP